MVQQSTKNSTLTAWPLKTGPTVCPETSVRNYHSRVGKITREHRSHLILRLTVLTLTGRRDKWLRTCIATSTAAEYSTLFVNIWTPLAIQSVNQRFNLQSSPYLALRGCFIKHLFKYSLSIPMQLNVLLKNTAEIRLQLPVLYTH